MTTINDRVKALSPEKREALAQLLQQKRAGHSQPRNKLMLPFWAAVWLV